MIKVFILLFLSFSIYANEKHKEINFGDINKGKNSLLPLLETQPLIRLDSQLLYYKVINEEINMNIKKTIRKNEININTYDIDSEYLIIRDKQKQGVFNIDSEYFK